MRTILLVLLFPALGLAQVDLSSSAQVKNVLRVGNGGTGSATFGAFTLFGNNTNATAAPTIVGMDSLFGSCSGANSALTYNTSTHAFGCNTITPGTGTVTSIVFSSPLTGGTITTTGSVGITQATTSTDGYLSSTDWNTFNGKQAAGSYALQSTTLTASSPLTGGGDLSTNRAFGCQAASGAQAGCLSSTDWSTFNGKQAALSSTTAVAHQYLTAFTAPNTFSQAQPVCADLSDSSGGCSMSTTAGGDLAGTLPSPTVTATHLASALPIAQGGTGAGTAATAFANLAQTPTSPLTESAGVYACPTCTTGPNTTIIGGIVGAGPFGTAQHLYNLGFRL